MRTFFGLLVLIGIGLAADQIAFRGRYREEAWQEAKQQGAKLDAAVRASIKKVGL